MELYRCQKVFTDGGGKEWECKRDEQAETDARLGALVRRLPDGMGLQHYENPVASHAKWFVTRIGWRETYYGMCGEGDMPEDAIADAFADALAKEQE